MRAWTTTEVKQLAQLYADGLPLDEIGSILGRGNPDNAHARNGTINSALALHGVRDRVGRRVQPWTPEQLRELEDMYIKGVPLIQIGRHFGRSDRNCSNALTNYGIRQRVGRRR